MSLLSEPIVQVIDFFTYDECLLCINHSEKLGFKKAKLAHKGRNNLEVFEQNEILRDAINSRIKQQFNLTNFLLSQHLEFYKYNEGHSISVHTDKSKLISKDIFSTKTLLIYLNDNFYGGATLFPSQNISISPLTGMLILFDQDYLLHEGGEILSGTKYILRTDIAIY